jgi:hypothetical protein
LVESFESGRDRIGQVGNAPPELFEACDMVEFATDRMDRHLG